MEKKLNFCAMLSLKQITLRRVSVILWSKTKILSVHIDHDEERKVKEDISNLGLPQRLTEEMNDLMTPIKSEIRIWKLFQENYLHVSRENFDIHLFEQLHWTVLGTIDYRKTAENLIRHKMLYIHQRYRLACLYCLDDCIPILWEKLPDWRRSYFYKKNIFDYGTLPPLEYCWPYILKGEGAKLDRLTVRTIGNVTTFNKQMFEYSARTGNIAATEYFLRKLTNSEREASLFRTTQVALSHRLQDYSFCLLQEFPEQKLSDSICYLLSQMSPEQQKEICKEKPYNILTCLLDWPRQDLFGDVAELIWPFLTAVDYINVINRINRKVRAGYPLAKLFQEFFVRGTGEFIKYFVDNENQEFSSLNTFFGLRDSDTIKLIFTNLDSENRKRLLSYRYTFTIFYESVSKGDCNLVEFCLQEVTLSKEDKEELKEAYYNFLKETLNVSNVNQLQGNMWKQFLHFFS